MKSCQRLYLHVAPDDDYNDDDDHDDSVEEEEEPNECPPVVCRLKCYVWLKDERTGCPVCRCGPDPKQQSLCSSVR